MNSMILLKAGLLLPKIFNTIFWIFLSLDSLHIFIWLWDLDSLDEYNLYRAILGAISFVMTVIFTFLVIVPLEKMTKIDSIQPFQKKFQGKIRLVYIFVGLSLLSLFVRLSLSLVNVLPFQDYGPLIWGFATSNSISSAACILQIKWFRTEWNKTIQSSQNKE